MRSRTRRRRRSSSSSGGASGSGPARGFSTSRRGEAGDHAGNEILGGAGSRGDPHDAGVAQGLEVEFLGAVHSLHVGAPGLARPTAVELPESVVDLVVALRALSPNQRAAAVLRWYADLPTRDVARAMGCSQATVRVHLSQAKRRLRPLLEERHD